MDLLIHMFLSIAEIAGVFVGFAALISVAGEQPPLVRFVLVGVVMTGMGVLIGALLPVWLSSFGFVGQTLWTWSAGALLILIWLIIGTLLLNPEFRASMLADVRANPGRNAFFWICLELPIQGSLILAIIGIAPGKSQAFYLTALVLNLFEAAYQLARLVLGRDLRATPGS